MLPPGYNSVHDLPKHKSICPKCNGTGKILEYVMDDMSCCGPPGRTTVRDCPCMLENFLIKWEENIR